MAENDTSQTVSSSCFKCLLRIPAGFSDKCGEEKNLLKDVFVSVQQLNLHIVETDKLDKTLSYIVGVVSFSLIFPAC